MLMSVSSEIAEKQRRIDEFLGAGGYDAVLLARSDNFAWFTGGGTSFVSLAQEAGVGALLVQRDRRILITNNVERPRLLEEELGGQGFGEDISLWTDDALAPAVGRVASGQKIAADVPLPGVTECASDIARLRASLTPEEVGRYRAVGQDVGAAIGEACMGLEAGMSEHEAAAALAAAHRRRGIQPIVVLVAADERLKKYRHPVPTDNEIKRVVMLVVCGRRHGLVVSATRIVHFGPVPEDLRQRHNAVVAVDAAFIAATRPRTRIGDGFQAGLDAYDAQGYPDEWKLHHQGGPTGYAPRDYRATARTDELVQPNQAFAWNPSITGTKSEDTIIATPEGPEISSASPGFPMLEVTAAGLSLKRPDILVR
jgi:Xaa-Pro aminopeptidase